MSELREAAIRYAQRGWYVFPLLPRSKHPNGDLVREGYQEASNWPPDCLYWWERSPDANIGIACHQSGLLVVDVDERAGGFDTLAEFEQRHGAVPKDFLHQITPTGGEHLVFRHPQVSLKGQLGPGVDIKDHGYILAAPSVHPLGGTYVWADEEIEPGPMPEAWVSALEVSVQARREALSPSESPLLQVPAEDYAEILTGRQVVNGWMQCPFHKGGEERTPSFKVQGPMWACFGCEPLAGKQVMGGNILDLAAMLKGRALPLRGSDLRQVIDEMEVMFNA